jgi:hypothetical protein
VAPAESTFQVAGPGFRYDLPPWSLAVLRLKTR